MPCSSNEEIRKGEDSPQRNNFSHNRKFSLPFLRMHKEFRLAHVRSVTVSLDTCACAIGLDISIGAQLT